MTIMWRCLGLLLWLAAVLAEHAVVVCRAEDAALSWSTSQRDESGIVTHEWTTPYQQGMTRVRILLPKELPADKQFPVVYVLPVEAGLEQQYGDGLAEVVKCDCANKFHAIFVAPTFSALPWYADHPVDQHLRQESYLLQAVLPTVERHYPAVAKRSGRLLLGFSKSGWGAWSLLLRHPDVFERAAAFDAPLMKDQPNQFRMGPVFGTQANFEQYQVTTLLKKRAADFKAERQPRLILLDRGNFQDQHEQILKLMKELECPVAHVPSEPRKHDWHSGWVAEAVTELFKQHDSARK